MVPEINNFTGFKTFRQKGLFPGKQLKTEKTLILAVFHEIAVFGADLTLKQANNQA